MEPPKHSSSHLKALWKKAIMEQIILIRLEREQKKLKSNLLESVICFKFLLVQLMCSVIIIVLFLYCSETRQNA